MRLWDRIRRVFHRAPDFYIGGKESPYLRRWWVIPRNKYLNIYLHNQLRDDDDRALHDHSYFNISFVLRGGYIEHRPARPEFYPKFDQRIQKKIRRAGSIIFRPAELPHRLQLLNKANSSWSLFLTGPWFREWGFICIDKQPGKHRWVPWWQYTDPLDSGKTGKGCGA